MKIVLKGKRAQRFIDPLLDFMVKNPDLFVDDMEDESDNVVTKCNSDNKEILEEYLTLAC